ncbi:Cytochrome P450 [Metarhizium album ARSEF 1941]|uniref:Cytochrome P450 monooxygenase ABA1 n=1 Tax=Metarhizium album (strain ARSEF 1941) TaxID=1081103 RepID=A0A0B2X563_METAS|nr:Cytochrome P450 [Metarhizium album ARSEF 1941]KHO01514.1 Cytochrome P450 [Metarhizium album ARSEF 1941]
MELALLALGLVGLYMVKLTWHFVKLRRFPGPPCTGISNIPHSRAMLRGECHKWYADVSRKYGPIARVAPNVLITSSPQVWAHVNNTPGYRRSPWYYNACRIEYRRDNVFSETDNEKHDRRRKQMAPGYSGTENLHLEASIDECLAQLIRLIRSKYVSHSAENAPHMDLATRVQFFTLDVISKVGLGTAFGMLEADQDVDDYLKSSAQGLAISNTALATGFSWLAHSPLIGKFIAPSPNDNSGFGKMMATCFRYVDQRASNPTDKRSDMLASFIRHGLSGDELRTEALEQIIAGSDTTATAIRATLLHVMTNPRVYAKLQREIDDAVHHRRAPAQGDGLISAAQAKQLPYLQAVIREALRVHPPVTNIFSRDVPAAGDMVTIGRRDGTKVFLPGGVSIGYSAYAMHHDKEIYGDDADAFRPERWFEADEAKLRAMTATNELIFGHGKFQCLGKKVAQLELGKSIFEMFRNFDMAVVHPTQPWTVQNCLGLLQITDMWVQVSERTGA